MSKIINEYLRLKRIDKEKMYLFKVGKFYIFIGEDADNINNYMVLKKTKFTNEYEKCGFPIDKINDYERVFKNLKLNIEIIDEIKENSLLSQIIDLDIDNISLADAKSILQELKNFYKN